LNIDNEIHQVQNIRPIEDCRSEHNSPINQSSFRRSSNHESEAAPFFGLASSHKTDTLSDKANSINKQPIVKDDSIMEVCFSQSSEDEHKLKQIKHQLSQRKRKSTKPVETHNLVHEDSMMNIGACRQDENEKKTYPLMACPSIEDIEEDHTKEEAEEVIGLKMTNRQNNTISEDESAIEETKSNDHLTSNRSLSQLVKSISFNELGKGQEPAVIGLHIGTHND
jgi:hypothetical protein